MLKDNNVCMFTDCAVIPEPTSAQLADIAISTAGVYKRVMGDEARGGPAFLLHEGQRQA